MKKIYLSILLFSCISSAYCQMTGELFTGTLKPGSTPNSAMIAIKSSAAFSGQFSNLQFTIQIPNSVNPKPTVAIKSNPLITYVPTSSYVTDESNEGGYYNYLFAVVPTGSPVYSFAAGTEIDALELSFSGAPAITSDIRLAQLADGGSTSQFNFYTEISGNDNTNSTSPFYGVAFVNGGTPYSSYSFVPLSNVVLPVVLSNFSVEKKENDGVLSWQVEHQDANSNYFELERSFSGSNFTTIGSVKANYNGSVTARYSFNDLNIVTVKPNGVAFYRIRMVDKDGRFTYSQTRSLRLNNRSFGVNIYPNPAKNFSTAIIQLEDRAKIILTLTDASGKNLQTLRVDGLKGLNQQRINMSGFAKGTYLVKINNGIEVQTISLLKD